jgi:hypothetical protein
VSLALALSLAVAAVAQPTAESAPFCTARACLRGGGSLTWSRCQLSNRTASRAESETVTITGSSLACRMAPISLHP